jgi:hypothetical protein
LRKQGLLLGREIDFDPLSDWYLMAWDAFRAEEFPADEARKLAIALGLDLEDTLVRTKKVIGKKGSTVILQKPTGRRKRGVVDPDAQTFDAVVDAAHTSMLVYDEDGARACDRWLNDAGLRKDARLKAFLQAMANAIPVTKVKGEYVRSEIATLDRMNDALDLGIVFPKDEEPQFKETQGKFDYAEEEPDDEGEDEQEGD